MGTAAAAQKKTGHKRKKKRSKNLHGDVMERKHAMQCCLALGREPRGAAGWQ
jgi:hypothetical protein